MNSSVAVAKRMKNVKITDKEFFTSGYFAGYLSNIIGYPCKDIKRVTPRIVVDYNTEKSAKAAYTDDKEIYLNAAFRFVREQKSREMQTLALIGLATHEFGHYRFTDFTAATAAQKSLLAKKEWYPALRLKEDDYELQEADIDFRAYLCAEENEKKIGSIVNMWHHICNIIEDGYVEESVYSVLSGQLTDGLSLLRQYQLETLPSFSDMVEHGDKIGRAHV